MADMSLDVRVEPVWQLDHYLGLLEGHESEALLYKACVLKQTDAEGWLAGDILERLTLERDRRARAEILLDRRESPGKEKMRYGG